MKIKEITLKEIVEDIDQLGDYGTVFLYKKRAVNFKRSILIDSENDKELPIGYNQARYFLEIDLIKDVIAIFNEWHEKYKDDKKKFCEAVIYYAINNAYKE